MPTLVTAPIRSGTGDNGRRAVRVEQPVGDEAAHDLVARLGDVAERVLRVDAGHLQADATRGCVVVEVAEHADLHAVGQAQPVLLQHRSQAHAGRREELHVDDGAVALADEGRRRG